MTRITREDLQQRWETKRPATGEEASEFLRLADQLVPDEERKLLRGKRVELCRLKWGQSQAAGYNAEKVTAIGGVLKDLGLVSFNGEWRDRRTGERCKTRLVELGRLDRGDWNSPANRAWLGEQWTRLMQLPLRQVIAEIRSQTGRARSVHSVDFFIKQIGRVLEWAKVELDPSEYEQLVAEMAKTPAKPAGSRIITFPGRVGDLNRGDGRHVSAIDPRR